jgi:hypothetical protein
MPSELESIRNLLRSRSPVADWLKRGVASGKIRSTDEIDPEDEVIVVAGPVHDGVEGSKQAKCAECSAVVWLAPSTQEMMKTRTAPVTIKCLGCVLKGGVKP